MRIGILGTRGVPARYGGFETLAEELSARLAARGHDVTVYTRSRYATPGLSTHRGAKVRVLPTIPTKYLDTVVHGAISGVDAAFERFDAVLVCNAINAASSFLPRLSGRTRVVLNVDGLERHRRKWSAVGKLAYRLSEWLSTAIPDAVVTDARVIEDYYRTRYGIPSVFIPYGGDLPQPAGRATLDRLSLTPERYVLYVSRLEPENNALAVVRAYRAVRGDVPLVLVGDAPYAAAYIAQLRAEARSARPVAGRHLWRGVPGAAGPRRRLRAGDGGRRHAPGARRGHGLRPRGLLQRDAGERGGRRGRGAAVRRPRPLLPDAAAAGDPG